MTVSPWTVFLSAVILSSVATIAAPIPDTLPQPIYTRQNQFSIPFQIDPSAAPNNRVTKVQLYVSENRGATWGRYSEIDPQQGRFAFRARRDGEYWFSIRTLDSQSSQAATVDEPELVVVVDTTPPKLELTAQRGRAGEIIAQWKIIEPSLDPTSLRVDYRSTVSADPWQPLAVEPIDPASPGPEYTGSAVWWDPTGAGEIHVRIQVRDLAGNPAASDSAAQTGSRAAPDNATTDKARHGARYAEELPKSYPAAPRQWPPDQMASAPLSRSQNAHMRASDPPHLPDRFPGRQEPRNESPSTEEPRRGLLGESGPAPEIDPKKKPTSQPSPVAEIDPFADEAFGPRSSNVNRPTQSSPTSPPIANQFTPRDAVPGAVSLNDLPPGEQARMINSKQFAIEYALDLEPSQEAPVVELWGSRDGGHTWSRYATDEDRKSPIPVTVDDEGLYGFWLSSRANDASQSEAPVPGARPEILIGVDLTPPQARLVRVEQGQGAEAGKLQIAWEARDERLADQPASLYCSQGDGHSWTQITKGLQPSGSYAWRPPRGLATRFYFRLEVRDQAGNVTTADWPHPIMFEPPTAQGPTGGVTPYQNSTRGVRREQRYIR